MWKIPCSPIVILAYWARVFLTYRSTDKEDFTSLIGSMTRSIRIFTQRTHKQKVRVRVCVYVSLVCVLARPASLA